MKFLYISYLYLALITLFIFQILVFSPNSKYIAINLETSYSIITIVKIENEKLKSLRLTENVEYGINSIIWSPKSNYLIFETDYGVSILIF